MGTFLTIFLLEVIIWSAKPTLAEPFHIPPFMKICVRNLPKNERNDCLKESIQTFVPAIKDGYASLDIPSFDPYFIEKYTLEYGGDMFATKLRLTNATIAGAKDVVIRNVRSKVTDTRFYIEIDIFFETLVTKASFKGSTKFLETRVKSDGHSEIVTDGISYTLKLLGNLNTTGDEGFMIITASELSNIKLQQLKMDGTGFLPDTDLNQLALEFINQNWRALSSQMIPSMKGLWQDLYVMIVNKIFGKIPWKQLMPVVKE